MSRKPRLRAGGSGFPHSLSHVTEAGDSPGLGRRSGRVGRGCLQNTAALWRQRVWVWLCGEVAWGAEGTKATGVTGGSVGGALGGSSRSLQRKKKLGLLLSEGTRNVVYS